MLLHRVRAVRRYAALSLLPALLAAVCLGGFSAPAWGKIDHLPQEKDRAPGDIPKNAVHLSGDPCPDNITVETWTQSSTEWRLTYENCKPKGAPARYKYTQEDLEKFLRRMSIDYKEFGSYDLVFEKWATNVCRLGVVFRKGEPNRIQAATMRGSIVRRAALFFKANGHDLARENFAIAARAYVKGGKTRNIYSLYDYETGSTVERERDATDALWKKLN